MRKYIGEARAKGATPIVLSPVPRNIWKDGKVVRAAGDYGGWAALVARAENTLFVDLNEIVAREYEKIGEEKVGKEFFLADHTHTTLAGARLNADGVVKGVRELNCSLNLFLVN
jgi:hypothetical protein